MFFRKNLKIKSDIYLEWKQMETKTMKKKYQKKCLKFVIINALIKQM